MKLKNASSSVSLGGAISMGKRTIQRSVISVVLTIACLGWHLMSILRRFGDI
jgi:hypothetical protein